LFRPELNLLLNSAAIFGHSIAQKSRSAIFLYSLILHALVLTAFVVFWLSELLRPLLGNFAVTFRFVGRDARI